MNISEINKIERDILTMLEKITEPMFQPYGEDKKDLAFNQGLASVRRMSKTAILAYFDTLRTRTQTQEVIMNQ